MFPQTFYLLHLASVSRCLGLQTFVAMKNPQYLRWKLDLPTNAPSSVLKSPFVHPKPQSDVLKSSVVLCLSANKRLTYRKVATLKPSRRCERVFSRMCYKQRKYVEPRRTSRFWWEQKSVLQTLEDWYELKHVHSLFLEQNGHTRNIQMNVKNNHERKQSSNILLVSDVG